MDIFLAPENPSRPVPRAELYPDPDDKDDPFSRWDGGHFLTYPHRKNILHMIPPDLRHGNHPDNGTVQFTELINPTRRDLRHRIFTAWFYFGLLAEFLGGNRQDDANQAGDNSATDTVLQHIYEACVTTSSESGTGSKRYLTAAIIPRILPAIVSIINRLPEGPPRQNRADYLFKCLRLTAYYLNTILFTYNRSEDKDREEPFDPVLLTAIRGLGELLSAHLHHSIRVTKSFGPGIVPSQDGAHSFKGSFLARGSSAREEMVRVAGWCKSDLGRINSVYQRLFTVQYVSLLDRHVKGRRGDHGDCTEQLCLSAQIDNATYKLSHADEEGDCGCDEFEVDIEQAEAVLVNTKSWPILIFQEVEAEEGKEKEVTLGVKEFVQGVDEYVALSHVWADGLGNTRGNSLQRCQIARLRKLISDVELAYHLANPDQPRPKYRLWIDTLCCPVSGLHPTTNGISLTRMKSVYEQAAHVLVLDAALSVHEAARLTPADILLRCFASSIWMRRLWTLQEGVLARSLFFQFKDKPVHAKSLMDILYNTEDFRYKILWFDLDNEWNRLHDLNPETEKTGVFVLEDHYKYKMYRRIQSALDFRAVTYPSDEPICIATLLGLDLGRIIKSSEGLGNSKEDEEERAERRMCELWRILAENDVGGIQPRIVFVVDKPLKTEGFRWAPSSLLGNVDQGGDSAYKALGFAWKEEATKGGRAGLNGGYLTPYGLAVELPALVIEAKSLVEGMGLHDWDGVLVEQPEDVVYFYHQFAETWYRMIDWHTSKMAPRGTTVRELQDYQGMVPARPMCSAMDSGRIALLKSEEEDTHNAMLWLVVQMLDDGPVSPPAGSSVSVEPGLRARWIRRVIVAQVHGPEATVLHTMQRVAKEVAASAPETAGEFLRAKELGKESEYYQVAREGLRQRMKDATARAWKEAPTFAQAVENSYGEGLEEFIWSMAPKYFPHERLARATAVDQRWFID
ncbi:hypothetical protein V8F20_002859 [Naviculisporaceae sp. PSN 640]